MPEKVEVAISSDFLPSVLRLPKQQQGKAVKLMEKFRRNPASPGGNYEIVNSARDKNLYSLRIDQTYRAIVLAPKGGSVYVLLWADKHDAAYEWAARKVFRVNPENGALQILDTEHIDEAERAKSQPVEGSDLFAVIRDRNLVRMGVPEELIPLVRNITVPQDLDDLVDKLPNEAYEALSLLADGETLEEVMSVYDITLTDEPSEIDTEDFVAALENPDSQRRFMLASDDEALQTMLNAPLEKWRVFLHPAQRKLVYRSWNGPVRVLGGAGTGKTVVAIHRAKWLIENVCKERGDRVLFTTFSRNLAGDIERNLSEVCSPELMRKVEVINLDAWVKSFLGKNGYKVNYAFSERVREKIWSCALALKPDLPALADSFYKEEWDKVIQVQNVSTKDEYLKASRTGRGVRLNRVQRTEIWPVFEKYRAGLNDSGLKEVEDAYRDVLALIEKQAVRLPYRGIVVDEAQDFGANAYRLLRAMVGEGKNDIFIVGDAHQRIYGRTVVLGQCGVKIVGRSRKLRVNYRTTEQIRHWAVSIMDGVPVDDLDGGVDSQSGYRSLMRGPAPEARLFVGAREELEFLVSSLKSLPEDEQAKACIVARRNFDVERYAEGLREAGIIVHNISRGSAEDVSTPGVRIATMHRIKGLEFDDVYVAGASHNVIPLDVLDTEDVTVVREHEWKERALLYVAITRAKRYCVVTGVGKLSPFLGRE